MSKSLAESAALLERKAQEKVTNIRQAVNEYNACLQDMRDSDYFSIARKQRAIDRVVAESIELRKAIKRLRKKMRAGK